MDYADLTSDQAVREALPELTTELKEQPQLMLNCLGLAIHQVWEDGKKEILHRGHVLMEYFYVHMFQVLTVDLENQAAELQEEELPVAAPIINIPHISAR